MKKALPIWLTISLCVMFFTATAQKAEWAMKAGATLEQTSNDITIDKEENVIIVGGLKGTNIDFDRTSATTNLSSSGDYDVFIAKYSKLGGLLWAFKIGSAGNDVGVNVAVDTADNSVYVSGWFRGTVDFDPSSNTANLISNGESVGSDNGFGGDAFLAKYTSDGQYIWAFNIGSTSIYDVGGDIAIDPSGNVLWSGSYAGSNVDFDPSPATNALSVYGVTETFLAKYTSTGQYVWAVRFGGASVVSCAARVIQLDDSDNIYLTGHFDGTIDLNPGAGVNTYSSNGCGDFYIVKLNSTAQYQWGFNIGGGNCDYVWGMALDTASNVYVTGQFSSTSVDFNPGAGTASKATAGSNDIFVVKYDKNGNFLFVNSHGSIGDDAGYSLATYDGGYILAGSFSNTVDFNPGTGVFNLVSNGSTDMVLARYSETGQFQNAFKVGGTLSEVARNIAYVPGSGSAFARTASLGEAIYVVGYFQSANVDFDPSAGKINFSSSGGNDVSLAKYVDLEEQNTIKGSVYLDRNSNGVKDANDPYYNLVSITSIKENIDTIITSSSNGRFSFSADTGRFITSIKTFVPYFQTVPDKDTTDFASYQLSDSISFAIQPIPDIKDLVVAMVPLGPARPGFPVQYRIIYSNVGTDTIQTGFVKLAKDARLLVDSTSPTASTSVADTLTWDFSDLAPGAINQIKVYHKVAVPPTITIGDTLISTVSIEPIASDSTPDNNVMEVKQIVIGSYDPNDKREIHGGSITPAQVAEGEYLQYTIRFQNTGTDTAFNINVRDTLSNKLDWASFQMVASSHDYQLTIQDGNKCYWAFNNIALVDSFENEPLSHGFIVFKVKPRSTVSLGDVIENKVSIYFDYNLPIETNVAQTVVENPVLPVALLRFDAYKTGSKNQLNWITAQESNSNHIEIERSVDGRLFEKIGLVNAVGNSNNQTSYNYIDVNPVSGLNFYRLKFVDKDGKFELSVIRRVNNKLPIDISVYPNPAKDVIGISLNSDKKVDLEIEIITLEGKLLSVQKRKAEIGSNLITLDLLNIPSGSYFLKVKSYDQQTIVKFLKL